MSRCAASEEPTIAVVGGGLVGAAIAWGLARSGTRVAVLDEGDDRLSRLARQLRAGLGAVQGPRHGRYAAWTRRSADAWAGLAAELKDETGIDVAHQQPGGFMLCLSEPSWSSASTRCSGCTISPR